MEPIGDIQVETLQETPKQASQPPAPAMEPPIAEVNPLKDLSPQLDDAAVRAAIAQAEANGQDPMALTMSDMETVKTQAPQPETKPVEVPEKFKKPNGELDAEKLKASTERLAEVVSQKEQKLEGIRQETAPQKSVEEMLAEYKALQKKNSQLPNPEKLAATVRPPEPPVPADPNQLTDEQLEALINADIQKNPARTIAEFHRILTERALGPILEERKDRATKESLKRLVEQDPRVAHPKIWEAIQAEISSDPDYLRMKNPHRAAWLEVKDRLRLGDAPNGAQAQPSRPPSPILGGGTPPASPSSLGVQRPALADLNTLDPRDKKQEAAGDALIRAVFAQKR